MSDVPAVLKDPAFFNQTTGYADMNLALVGRGTSFPKDFKVDGVHLSVSVDRNLRNKKWSHRLWDQGIPLNFPKQVYLCPDMEETTSYWIQTDDLKDDTTQIWAFKNVESRRKTGTTTTKMSTLRLGIARCDETGSMTLVKSEAWKPEIFTESPGGYDPIEAITVQHGGKTNFLGVVMMCQTFRKTLMHVDWLPAHIYQPDGPCWD